MKIYIFGGKNESEIFNDLYEYDIKLDKTIKIDSLSNPPTVRCNHTAMIYKKSMIIFGGWDGTRTLNDMYELSLNTMIWYQINYKSDLTPPSVYRHTSLVMGDTLLLFGGVNEDNEKFNEIYFMNFPTRKWGIMLASGEYPTPRTFHNFFSIENKLFIIGGFSQNTINDCHILHISDHYLKFFYPKYPIEDTKDNNILKNKKISKKFDDDLIFPDSMSIEQKIEILQNQVSELKNKYECEIAKNTCKICFEREINTVILDCHHRVICYDCSLKFEDSCPACKTPIKSILKTYN